MPSCRRPASASPCSLLSALIAYGIVLLVAKQAVFHSSLCRLFLDCHMYHTVARSIQPLSRTSLLPFFHSLYFLPCGRSRALLRNAFLLGLAWFAATAAGALVSFIFASQVPALLVLFTKWHQRSSGIPPMERHWSTVSSSIKAFIRQRTPPVDRLRARARAGDVVAATDPQWVYLRSGLKSVFPPFDLDPARAQRLLDSVPVTFLMVDEGDLQEIHGSRRDRVPGSLAASLRRLDQ